jgi:carbamoyl-phosphate synthase large subunit
VKNINILFLGAGNRLSLLEQFTRAAEERLLKITIFSAESTNQLPIRYASKIIIAPKFNTSEFKEWLINFVKKEGVNIIIPNMDSATVSLAEVRHELRELEVFAVVSSLEICTVMEDKKLSDSWFRSKSIPTPGNMQYPLIIKKRFGFGSKDQRVVKTDVEKNNFFDEALESDFFVQEYIVGAEYTVDAYIDRAGNLIGLVPRKRLRVIDGEVNESLTVRHEAIERITKDLLTSTAGWLGPVTLQYIDSPRDGCKIIEINPRFGGGATHSIHCGLDMPGWIFDEYNGAKINPLDSWKVNSLMTRCRRDIFHEYIG